MENKAEQGENGGNDTGPSNNQMNSVANVNGDALRMRMLAYQLEKKYLMSYISRRVKYCPDTRCNNYDVTFNITKHYLEEHQVPRFTIELDKCYVAPIELQELEYGISKIVAILLVPFTRSNTPNDHSAMPLAVLATKINLCANTDYLHSYTNPSNTENKLLKKGDIVMIWVCGHMEALRMVLKVTSANEISRYVYCGHIHHLAANNHQPHMVFARGNCLLVPAPNITTLTDNGTVPLDIYVKICKEQEL